MSETGAPITAAGLSVSETGPAETPAICFLHGAG